MNFENLKNKIKGPVYPIVTPFTENYDVDYERVREYIDFLYAGGARIFHVMVHTSRFGLLTYKEMLKLNETVATHIKSKYNDCVVIVADPLYKSTKVSVDFAKHAEASGADIIGLIFLERFYTEDQPYEFFETVANSCNIGILIHEQHMHTIHGTKLMNWPLHILERICDIDNVVAMKEDAKQDDYTKQVVETLKDKVAIEVSGGSKEQFITFAPMGCQAYLVGVASFDPAVGVAFYNNYLAGNEDECWRIINEIERPFFDVSKKYGWHIGLKSALEILGIMDRTERPPMPVLPAEHHREIEQILKDIGYTI